MNDQAKKNLIKYIVQNIKSTQYFTAMEGVLGEACSECAPDTRLEQIIYRDGEATDEILDRTTICVLIMSDGAVVIGSTTSVESGNVTQEFSRKCAYDNAVSKIMNHIVDLMAQDAKHPDLPKGI